MRIALHFGPLLVDSGKVQGDEKLLVQELLKKSNADQIVVTAALVDIAARTVTVSVDGAERAAIVGAIEDQGYLVEA